MAQFAIDGAESLNRVLEQYPEMAVRRPLLYSFRKAAVPIRRAMQSSLPSYISPVKKALAIRAAKDLTVSVGFWAKRGIYRNRRGQEWDPYQLVYWHNYGTLSSRASSHTFKTPRRKKTAAYKGGIKPRFFVETAVTASLGEAQRIFESTFDAQVTAWLEKEVK